MAEIFSSTTSPRIRARAERLLRRYQAAERECDKLEVALRRLDRAVQAAVRPLLTTARPLQAVLPTFPPTHAYARRCRDSVAAATCERLHELARRALQPAWLPQGGWHVLSALCDYALAYEPRIWQRRGRFWVPGEYWYGWLEQQPQVADTLSHHVLWHAQREATIRGWAFGPEPLMLAPALNSAQASRREARGYLPRVLVSAGGHCADACRVAVGAMALAVLAASADLPTAARALARTAVAAFGVRDGDAWDTAFRADRVEDASAGIRAEVPERIGRRAAAVCRDRRGRIVALLGAHVRAAVAKAAGGTRAQQATEAA